ncbi:MAG TPA: DUF1385 domain-containing protein [Myxococcota bacterium]|nr:DUF1385 domain-containing protein [Myxococcota bacterium]
MGGGRTNEPLSSMNVGGQAVLEGVMMRSPGALAIALRQKDGRILVKDATWASLAGKAKFLRWPFFRGALVFGEALYNGMAAMRFSAEQMEIDQGDDESDAPRSGPSALSSALLAPWLLANAASDDPSHPPVPAPAPVPVSVPVSAPVSAPAPAPVSAPVSAPVPVPATAAAPAQASRMGRIGVYLTMALGVVFALFVFKGLPHLLTWALTTALNTGITVASPWFHLIDGAVKAAVFVGYIVLIGRLPDIKRVFEYHGAEHKVIWSWERGRGLTVAGAQAQSRRHPRCGTSFLLIVILVSIAVFAATFPFLQRYVTFFDSSLLNALVYIVVKVPLMLPVAGIAYEIVRFSGRRAGQAWVRPLIWPGLAMQGLTTREPADDQVEVALAALRRALWRERVQAAGGAAGAPAGEVASYARAEDIPLPDSGIEAAFPAAA